MADAISASHDTQDVWQTRMNPIERSASDCEDLWRAKGKECVGSLGDKGNE
jgi:hypothetical protein